jgi:predicted lipid-binding transport protein (Tim44 family)
LLGVIAFATRGRFEGLVGMVTGKGFEAVTVVPIILIILGVILITTHFV